MAYGDCWSVHRLQLPRSAPMTWLWFALLASLAWATVQLVDKTLVSTEAPSPNHYLVASGIAAIAPSVLMPLLVGAYVTTPAPVMMLGGIAAGVLYFASNAFFFKALLHMDASLSAAALAAVPGVTALGSWLILSESVGLLPVAGILVIALGVIVMSGATAESRRHRPPLRAWLLLMVAGTFLVAEYLVEGSLVRELHALDVFFWTRIGVVGCVAAFALVRWRFVIYTIRWAFVTRRRVGALTVSNEALDMIAVASLIAAFSVGPVGLSTAAAYTQVAFVFLITILVNALRPQTIPTEGDKRGNLLWRTLGLTAVVAGVFLTTT